MSRDGALDGVDLVAGDRVLLTGQPCESVRWWIRALLWFRVARTVTDIPGRRIRYKRLGRRQYVRAGGRWVENRINGVYVVGGSGRGAGTSAAGASAGMPDAGSPSRGASPGSGMTIK